MALEVDVNGIKRHAGRPATRVEIRSPMPVEDVVRIVRSAHSRRDGSDPAMALTNGPDVYLTEDAQLTSSGVVVGLSMVSYRDLERTLERWAAGLNAAGLEGTIGPYVPDKPLHDWMRSPGRTDNLIAAMIFRGDDGGVGGARQVPSPVMDEFLSVAFDWGRAAGGEIHVCHDLTSSRAADDSDAHRFLTSALPLGAPVSIHWSTAGTFRTMGWDRAGHAWIQIADTRPWPDQLAELEGLVELFSPHLLYALIRLGSADEQTWTNTLTQGSSPPGAGGSYLSYINNLEETHFVPDAYGTQLLGPEHLAHTTDLSSWEQQPCGHLTWVRSPTPASWFRADPEEVVVRAARMDFGAAILTRDQCVDASKRERDRPLTTPEDRQ